MINIEIEMDRVIVEGVEIKRPMRIARGDWVDFWRRATYERTEAYSNVCGGH